MRNFESGTKSLCMALLATTALAGPVWAQSTDVLVADEITVTATPLERTVSETVRPVTIVGRDEVFRKGGASIGEVLGDLPGVSQSSFARGASRPIIRGLDNSRVRVQENGLGSADVSAVSEDHGVPIDPLSAQSVEIIRGPGVLRYGTEAIGGVVSILNNRIPETVPEGGVGGEVFADASSVDNGYSLGGLIDVGGNGFALHGDGFYRDTSDYETPDDDVLDTYAETYGFSGGGSILFGNGFLGASATVFDAEYGIPAAEERLLIDLDQTKYAVAGGVSDIGGFFEKLTAKAVFTDYTHDEVEAETGDVGSTFDLEEWEARAEAVHRAINGVEGAIGVQYRSRDLEASGEGGELLAPSETTSFAGFIFEEFTLTDRVVLEASARLEYVEIDGTGFSASSFNGSLPGTTTSEFDVSRDFTLPSASAGLRFDLTEEAVLGVSVQYVQRAPDTLELFAKGPHEATETFEIGDSDLDTESALSFEATLKQENERGGVEFAAFYAQFNDFIFKDFTGLVCGEEFDTCGIEGDPGVEDELTQIAYAQSDADFWGFEVSGNLDLFSFMGGWVGADASFDYVEAELSGGDNVPRITPARGGVGVYYAAPTLFGRVGFLQVGEQDDVAPNETPTKGYTDLRASLVKTFEVANGGAFDIGVSGTNLLDEDARNHSSFKKDDVLLPGRNGRIFVRARF